MSACTVCDLDPCPHLKASGGTAGAPAGAAKGAGIKYAPSAKPPCGDCGRIHRNIGVDNKIVCAWRTFSKARGEEFTDIRPGSFREAAAWLDTGGWTTPVPKTRSKKAPTVVSVEEDDENVQNTILESAAADPTDEHAARSRIEASFTEPVAGVPAGVATEGLELNPLPLETEPIIAIVGDPIPAGDPFIPGAVEEAIRKTALEVGIDPDTAASASMAEIGEAVAAKPTKRELREALKALR